MPDRASLLPRRITTGICATCGRDRYRFHASFRQARILAFWRLGFRQCGFHHIARISRHAAQYASATATGSWHAIVPGFLSDHGSGIRSKDTSSSPCPLRGLYSSAPRGAHRTSSSLRLGHQARTTAPGGRSPINRIITGQPPLAHCRITTPTAGI